MTRRGERPASTATPLTTASASQLATMTDDNDIASGDSMWSNNAMAKRFCGPSLSATKGEDDTPGSAGVDGQNIEGRARAAYVTPVLRRLGNVRDIVGKTGPGRDNSQRFARKA